MHKAFHYLSYFAVRQWNFKNSNVIAVQNDLTESERIRFPTDLNEIKWPDFSNNCYIYIRRNLLNDKDS